MVPGMTHCYFGPGATSFGGVGQQFRRRAMQPTRFQTALERWVEEGVAPKRSSQRNTSTSAATRAVQLTRPLCAYPLVARYKGSGNPNDAKSFTCSGEDREHANGRDDDDDDDDGGHGHN